ncbi:MAG TPA: hypothetical protein VIA06_01355 [Candidatus Dormibacteraeota bacterium]|nr:hypothetical protein [Candidatus Dormibacteraeota bacterium]
MSAVLRLRRHSVVMEIVRGPFEVALDGAQIGTVNMAETFETPIQEGRHTIRLRSGRYSSRQHSFDVLDDEVASFQCHSGLVWPLWVLLLVRPSWVIWLRHL